MKAGKTEHGYYNSRDGERNFESGHGSNKGEKEREREPG